MHNRLAAASRILMVILTTGALSTGCKASVSTGSNEISRAEVESKTAEQLAAQLNQPKPTITCPSGLEAEVGAKLDCVLTAQGDTTKLPVHLVVDSVEGGTAHWNIEVGKTPVP